MYHFQVMYKLSTHSIISKGVQTYKVTRKSIQTLPLTICMRECELGEI